MKNKDPLIDQRLIKGLMRRQMRTFSVYLFFLLPSFFFFLVLNEKSGVFNTGSSTLSFLSSTFLFAMDVVVIIKKYLHKC